MSRNKYIFLFAGGLLLGILGFIFEIIYAIEEDGVKNEGHSSQFYEFTKPLVEPVLKPLESYWLSLWPPALANSYFGIGIIILFWSLFGFVFCLAILLIWSKLRKTAK